MRYLAVRDDAWARMDPEYRVQHRDLWLDVVRRVPDQHITAPGCMLAFTAWQNGHGVLANIALDRVQRTDPEYSLASLLRRALDSGAPPRVARLPMTPEEVADSYEISFGPESTEVPALDLDDPTIRRMYGLPPSQGTPESEQGPGA